MTVQEALGHVTYTPNSFAGYWMIENLPDGMNRMEWFGLRYRYFAKRDATVSEATRVMQEATFDRWRHRYT